MARDIAARDYDGCGRVAALVANALSFGLLWAYRGGDANMRSAWICTRNDVLGNLAVLLAAVGVFGTGTGWPDVIVAASWLVSHCKARGSSSNIPGTNCVLRHRQRKAMRTIYVRLGSKADIPGAMELVRFVS